MPRVFASTADRTENRIYNFIKAEMGIRNLNNTDIANEIGVTSSNIGYKFKNKALTVKDLVYIFEAFDKDLGEAVFEILKDDMGKEN